MMKAQGFKPLLVSAYGKVEILWANLWICLSTVCTSIPTDGFGGMEASEKAHLLCHWQKNYAFQSTNNTKVAAMRE